LPTTSAGLFAVLAFADEVVTNRGGRDVFNDGEIFSTFATAAKRLTRA
jgi:hypothetical protein